MADPLARRRVALSATLITLMAGMLLALPAAAQKPRGSARVGLLVPIESPSQTQAFRRGLEELGYVSGQNVSIEYRSAQGQFDQLPRLAAELVRLEVDVIVTLFTQASIAAKQATERVPIVMIGVADPVGAGLVRSLSRPGGNVTGTSSIAGDIVGKQFEALKPIVRPSASVAVLWNPANEVFQASMRREAESTARSLGMRLRFVDVRADAEVERAFATIAEQGSEAVVIFADPVLVQSHRHIAEQAFQRRLPSVGSSRAFAEAGGLIGYGPTYAGLARRAAHFVDKILKGGKPADLPVEQPTTFELAINLKTAKGLGIAIPPALLIRADHVIEP